ncbi:hypothetical protein EK904_005635 [Melospiza melodia maxima]|nr:hypothetical protein EK904_005635 [Melospiza melodia maxima]
MQDPVAMCSEANLASNGQSLGGDEGKAPGAKPPGARGCITPGTQRLPPLAHRGNAPELDSSRGKQKAQEEEVDNSSGCAEGKNITWGILQVQNSFSAAVSHSDTAQGFPGAEVLPSELWALGPCETSCFNSRKTAFDTEVALACS